MCGPSLSLSLRVLRLFFKALGHGTHERYSCLVGRGLSLYITLLCLRGAVPTFIVLSGEWGVCALFTPQPVQPENPKEVF